MDERNIVLIGFMGCGKSLTSNKLAGILDRKVFSTDFLVEQREGRSIAEIFNDSGEDFFRKAEKEAVKILADYENAVIDCGGGIVLDPENISNLKKSGLVIYLSATPETIYENIKNRKNRPLLNVEDPRSKIVELLAARKPYYEQADITIDANGKSIDQIVEDILKVVANE